MSKTVLWPKATNVTFTGRNGTGFCTGIDIQTLNYKGIENPRVMIAPLTSKGDIARCDIDIPFANLPSVIAAFQKALDEFNGVKAGCVNGLDSSK